MLNLEKYRTILNKRIYNFAIRTISTVQNKISLSKSNDTIYPRVSLSKKQASILNSEYKAVLRLIEKSSSAPAKIYIRNFHTTNPFQKENNQNKNNSKKSSNNDDKKKKNENEEKMMSVFTKAILWMLTIYMIIAVVSLILPKNNYPETSTRYVSWKEFVHHMLAAGEVKEIIVRPDMEMVTIILHESAIIKGRRVDSTVYHMAVADITKFEEKLRNTERELHIKDGVPIVFERSSDFASRLFITLALFAIIISIASRMGGMKAPLSMDSFTQMGRAKFTLVDPIEGGKGVLFRDVAGLQEAKQEVVEFVDYLKTPERYQTLGAKVPKGALLLGPPGCGKTLLAKAVATEAQVPFLSMNGSEFIEMIGGLGAARVRDLFKEAKKRSPCIIYIDEIDAIGKQRAGGGANQFSSGESEQTLNQLLVEMDGMASKEGVLMLASTNRADVLDKALLRPGRFDRHILIDLPNLSERKEIFEKHLFGIALENAPETYSARLAVLTPGFSGADIANVCNEAALHAARGGHKKVETKNLEYAVERLVGGTEKRSHALSTGERRVIAYHESGHALVGWLLKHSDVLLKVTIVPRTSLALGFAQYTPSEQKLYSKEELFDKMCMALGGRVAENLTFNSITTGAQNDLEKVTKIAYAQIKQFGMNDNIGLLFIPEDADKTYTGEKPYSKNLGNLIDLEARKLVAEAYSKTEQILRENKDKLANLAENLLKKETLNYDEVVQLIGPPAHEKSKKKIEPVDFEDSLKNLSNLGT